MRGQELSAHPKIVLLDDMGLPETDVPSGKRHSFPETRLSPVGPPAMIAPENASSDCFRYWKLTVTVFAVWPSAVITRFTNPAPLKLADRGPTLIWSIPG